MTEKKINRIDNREEMVQVLRRMLVRTSEWENIRTCGDWKSIKLDLEACNIYVEKQIAWPEP